MKQSHILFTVFTVLTLLHTGQGRDLRTVTEPKNPPICTTLKPSSADETKNIQQALDSCAKGKAVALSQGIFVSGPLVIPSGVSLLVENNATLEGSTDPKDYDLGGNKCGTVADTDGGCKALITISGATGSGIYGEGTIDGRGGSVMKGSNITWWHLARNALAVHKLQNNPKLVYIYNCTNITLYKITLVNSPFYHVESSLTFGFTVWGITINCPGSALNSDGIDPTGSINVTIAHCNISTGDDNIAISSLHYPSKHISVYNNYFGHGNSMGIGAGTIYGVSEVTITNLTMYNVRYGLYIDSNTYYGGLVTNVTYDNVCMYGSHWPITLDTNYYHLQGNYTPVYKNIFYNNIWVLTNGTFKIHGISKSHPVQISMKDVHVNKGSVWSISNAQINGTWEEDASGTSCGIPANEY